MLKEMASSRWGLPVLGIAWFGTVSSLAFVVMLRALLLPGPGLVSMLGDRHSWGLVALGGLFTWPAAVLGGILARRIADSDRWRGTFILGVLWTALGGFLSGLLLALHDGASVLHLAKLMDSLRMGAGVVLLNLRLFALPYIAGGLAAMLFRHAVDRW